MRQLKGLDQKGFTLVEMLVVAPIVILAIGAFLTAIIAMTGEVLASRASNNLSYNVQDALNRIEQDVKLSNGFLATNNVMGTNQGYNDDATAFTNIAGATGTSLILNMVATTINPVSANSSYVYLINKPDACATPQNNVPFTYNVVYFIKNNPTTNLSTLYRRTIMPANYNDTTNTVCVVPWQQPSCSPTYMDSPTGQTGTAFCKTKDIVLVEGVIPANFILQYFNGEGTTTVNGPASTAPLASDRTIALQSATTVGVSIDAQQTAAGRPIERTATLRVSRLDSNASGVATITTDGAPGSPKVGSTTSEPTNAIFSWPRVSTATGYTFEYQINGGGWNTGFTNQPTQTFTVTTATHKDVVNARVTAINSAGSSSYGTASVTIPLWTPLALQNTWANYSPPYTSAGYTKTAGGLIVLKGLVRTGSGVIGYLPAGYRPSLPIIFQVSSNQTGARLDVYPDGTILMSTGGSNAWFSLDGVAFMPSSTTFTPVTTFANSWTNYSPTAWQPAGYTLDGAGRVELTGLIAGGGTTSGTVMLTLPVGYRPPEYTHVLNDDGGASAHFSVDSGGNVINKATGNSYLALQYTFFPASRGTGTTCTTQWCALPTMQNGWVFYGGGYSTPQYTKASDGLVMLKGLISGGSSNGAQITTLPVGFCPAETQLLATTSIDLWSRLDIIRNSDGTCAVLPAAGSTAWIALDNIHYMAEP